MLNTLRPPKTNHFRIQNLSQKQAILPYLESACARKNQLVLNMGM